MDCFTHENLATRRLDGLSREDQKTATTYIKSIILKKPAWDTIRSRLPFIGLYQSLRRLRFVFHDCHYGCNHHTRAVKSHVIRVLVSIEPSASNLDIGIIEDGKIERWDSESHLPIWDHSVLEEEPETMTSTEDEKE